MIAQITTLIAVILSVSMIISGSLAVNADSLYVDGDYTFADIDSNNVALYAYDGQDQILTVPEYFSQRAVSEIYAYAFEENTGISGLDFSQNGNRLKAINTKAFNECTELSGDLVLPSSLRTLGFAAFQGCIKLESLTVNYGLNEIPAQCFNRCSGLKTITLAPSVESIGNLAFAKCTSLESVYLPSSVTFISPSAFNESGRPTLYVYYNSYAHNYAVSNSIPYVLLDGVKLGDVNGDGYININDVTAVQTHLAEFKTLTGIAAYVADIDGSGEVKIDDATILQEFLAEYQVAYSIGEVVTQ